MESSVINIIHKLKNETIKSEYLANFIKIPEVRTFKIKKSFITYQFCKTRD